MQLAWIAQDALELIGTDGQKRAPRETGGPLFGYESCGELVIARALPPGPRAFHAPWLYRPDRTAVQAAIDEVRRQSAGRERWIGSWHTHPLGAAVPSLTDRRTARRIAEDRAVGCPEPVMLIQALQSLTGRTRPGRLGAYRYRRPARALRAIELRPATIEPLGSEGSEQNPSSGGGDGPVAESESVARRSREAADGGSTGEHRVIQETPEPRTTELSP